MRITVVGTGYVGLVTGACVAHLGHEVICVDAVHARVEAVNQGRPPFHEPGLAELLEESLENGRLRATTDVVSSVASSELTILAVGTPCHEGDIDLSYIKAATEQIAKGMLRNPNYHVVVVKSTVVPGTTDTVVRGILDRSLGRRTGSYGLCMNPEFLREGDAISDFLVPDRIVIGQSDQRAGQTLAAIYDSFNCPKIFTTLRNAEMTKYASNALLATMISFSNEIAALCEATEGTDVDQVMDGLYLDRRLTTPVEGRAPVRPGIVTYLKAGCGFGGSCLPKDVTALRVFGKNRGVTPHLLNAVLEVNKGRPEALVGMLRDAIGNLHQAKIAILGLAFKQGTDDLRDSPALAILRLLREEGAILSAYDPFVPSLPGQPDVRLCASAEACLTGADAAIITSLLPGLAGLDWNTLAAKMKRPVLVDGRNALRGVQLPDFAEYIPIGRHYTKETVHA
jgi:UDPglucose 6-dehydrogenase/GDP-mannose 6-dehydrogenase